LAQFEGHGLKVRLEQPERVRREGCEKSVANRCLLRVGHGALPHGGKSASSFRLSPSRLRPRSSASDEANLGAKSDEFKLMANVNPRCLDVSRMRAGRRTVRFQTISMRELSSDRD